MSYDGWILSGKGGPHDDGPAEPYRCPGCGNRFDFEAAIDYRSGLCLDCSDRKEEPMNLTIQRGDNGFQITADGTVLTDRAFVFAPPGCAEELFREILAWVLPRPGESLYRLSVAAERAQEIIDLLFDGHGRHCHAPDGDGLRRPTGPLRKGPTIRGQAEKVLAEYFPYTEGLPEAAWLAERDAWLAAIPDYAIANAQVQLLELVADDAKDDCDPWRDGYVKVNVGIIRDQVVYELLQRRRKRAEAAAKA